MVWVKPFPPLKKLTINGIDGDIGAWEQGTIDSTNGNLSASTIVYRYKTFIDVQPNSPISYKLPDNLIGRLFEYTENGTFIKASSPLNLIQVTTSPTTKKLRVHFYKIDLSAFSFSAINPMLNLGSIPAPYSKKTGDKMVVPVLNPTTGKYQVNKLPKRQLQAKTGVAFNGVTDYLQVSTIPVLDNLNEAEIRLVFKTGSDITNQKGLFSKWATGAIFGCLVDIFQSQLRFFWGNGVAIFSYNVSPNTWYDVTIKKTATQVIRTINGIEEVISNLSKYPIGNAEPICIGAKTDTNIKSAFFNGEMKKVSFSSVPISFAYDFENPQNVVGDKVLQPAKNLIPSFEDARWSLHANAKVLGKDVLRLEAAVAGQYSVFDLAPTTNQKYLLSLSHAIKTNQVVYVFINGVATFSISPNQSSVEFTTPGNTTSLVIKLGSSISGTFDFIRPALYQLDGKEGTIVGAPTKLRKTSKRSLYSKR